MTNCDIMTKSFLYIIINLKIWLANVASFPQQYKIKNTGVDLC